MFKVASMFFLLAIFSYGLGLIEFANMSIELGRILLIIFLLGAIVSFVVALTNDSKPKHLQKK